MRKALTQTTSTLLMSAMIGAIQLGSAHAATVKKPNLDEVWISQFGKIHWRQGFYNNSNNRISGQLFQDSKGKWIYSGRWSRANSSRNGHVHFTFSDDGYSLKGAYTSEDPQRKEWNGLNPLAPTTFGNRDTICVFYNGEQLCIKTADNP